MKYLKSKLFTSLFATLLILSFCMAKPAQVHASNADSAKMARWMSICSSMADNIEKKHLVYSNGGTARTYNSAVKRSRRSNCALYVSWCLQKYGALGSGQTFYIRRGSSSIRKNFGHWKKKKVQVIRVNKRASPPSNVFVILYLAQSLYLPYNLKVMLIHSLRMVTAILYSEEIPLPLQCL